MSEAVRVTVPMRVVPLYSSTLSPAIAPEPVIGMVKLGVVLLVTLSVLELPVSLAEVRSGRLLADGAVASITSAGERGADIAPRVDPKTTLEVMLE
jgi:hypothetical protein